MLENVEISRCLTAIFLMQGSFGNVFEGEFGGKPVAIKAFKLRKPYHDWKVVLGVLKEVKVMCEVHDPNLLRPLAVCYDHPRHPPLLLVLPLATCSLNQLIHTRNQPEPPKFVAKLKLPKDMSLTSEEWFSYKLVIAYQMSQGLKRLHEMNIVHRFSEMHPRCSPLSNTRVLV